MSRHSTIAKVERSEDMQDKVTWSRLIHDAEAQIEAAKQTIRRLRRSIRFFEEQRASGKVFPVGRG